MTLLSGFMLASTLAATAAGLDELPAVWQRDDLYYLKASDEHGVVSTPDCDSVSLGSKLLLVPGHCDPTVNLYDQIICVRSDRVEAIWPISARGALL
jgi:D-serine deaminase-like pyridoxal phosphate-dependent protein